MRRERVAELTPHEILGSTASPDGTSWCILGVLLKEPVPESTLRALWATLKEQQDTAWGRFTCRFYLPDMDPCGDSWADVNDIMILRACPPTAPEADAEVEEGVVVERGENYCIIEHRGVEMKVSWASESARPDLRDVWFPDPLTGDRKRIRVVDPLDPADPPR